MKRKEIWFALWLLAAAVWAAGCSTTRRLAEGEVLYVGVRRMEIKGPADSAGRERDLPGYVRTAARDPLSVRPNNPLISPYVRTPLPIGLWAWNHLYTPKEKGFRHWLYNWLAKEPVTIGRVRPEVRLEMTNQNLQNVGFFGARTSYEILPRRNPKKARISYRVEAPEPISCDSLEYLPFEGTLGSVIDSLYRTSLLSRGMQFNIDTFVMERNRITNVLRNKGYFYFRPEYVRYQADTTWGRKLYAMRMLFDPQMPEAVKKPYRVGHVHFNLRNVEPGDPDTLRLRRMLFSFDRPLRIRPRVLRRAITIRQGDLFTVAEQNATQTNLNQLGMFRYVNMSVTPLDSLDGADSLNVYIQAQMERPLEARFEASVHSRSNSFVGPGSVFSLRHNNLFRGGEVLTLRFTGSYEWQTGNRDQAGEKASLVNSYQFGVGSSLRIPRITPFPWGRRSRFPTGTTFQIGADLMNRSGFFQMVSFSGSVAYDFQTSRYSSHSIAPVRLVYNRLLHQTALFNERLEGKEALRRSFENQLIPSLNYVYTFDRPYRKGRDRLWMQVNFTSAGNAVSGVLSLFGKQQPQYIFGNQFSQFVKGIYEIRHFHKIGDNNTLATRFIIGAGWPYGNSARTVVDELTGEERTVTVLPYAEQFYIGGANSIRAFTIRTLGPGSYLPAEGERIGNLDQTGEFKLEANAEFRFGIINRLSGAVFVDAGNVWLLRDDPMRPGGKLSSKNFFNEIALGTGVGLRVDVSLLILRLDLGIAIHTPYENPNRRGYYNISNFRDGLGLHLAIGYPF